MPAEHNVHQLDLLADHPSQADAFLTIAEAARRVRCCERTIRRAVDSGALRAGRVRAGRGSRGVIRIRPTDLDAWLFADEEGDLDAAG